MLCCSSAPNVKQRKALSSKMAAACKVGDSKEVKRRLELGEKPNAPPAIVGGMTALMIAVFNGHEKVVKVLAKAGANVDQQEEDDGNSSLMLAALNNQIGCVRRLLFFSANLELRNRAGETALDIATQHARHEVAALLMAIISDESAMWQKEEASASHEEQKSTKSVLPQKQQQLPPARGILKAPPSMEPRPGTPPDSTRPHAGRGPSNANGSRPRPRLLIARAAGPVLD